MIFILRLTILWISMCRYVYFVCMRTCKIYFLYRWQYPNALLPRKTESNLCERKFYLCQKVEMRRYSLDLLMFDDNLSQFFWQKADAK